MSERLEYTRDELLADRHTVRRVERDGVLFHGGYDSSGVWRSPRSLHREDAIKAWTEALTEAGLPAAVMSLDELPRAFFPNAEQAKHLLRNGARGAMCRILTLIGIVEGFGNDGINLVPRIDLQPHFVESIGGTALDHLRLGLLDAHGQDEAGSIDRDPVEAGHDTMWFAVRDASLDHPTITPDMFEGIPVMPPPGYRGPASPSEDALQMAAETLSTQTVAGLDPTFDVYVKFMTQLLFIELTAFDMFTWAIEVLGDAACAKDADFATETVAHIRQDETLHVGYLQAALAETAARTVRLADGTTMPGAEIVRLAKDRVLDRQLNERIGRVTEYRMCQVREELAQHDDGDRILAEFEALRIPA
jgi:hypothetical protein